MSDRCGIRPPTLDLLVEPGVDEILLACTAASALPHSPNCEPTASRTNRASCLNGAPQ
jgi:hypothetical protein